MNVDTAFFRLLGAEKLCRTSGK